MNSRRGFGRNFPNESSSSSWRRQESSGNSRSNNQDPFKSTLNYLLRADNENVSSYLQNNLKLFTQYLDGHMTFNDIVKIVIVLSKFSKSQMYDEVKSSIFTEILPEYTWKVSIFILCLPILAESEKIHNIEFQKNPEYFWLALIDTLEEVIRLEETVHKRYIEKLYYCFKNFISNTDNLRAFHFPDIPIYLLDSVKNYLNYSDKKEIILLYPSYEEIVKWEKEDCDFESSRKCENSEEFYKIHYSLIRDRFMITLSKSLKTLQRSVQVGNAEEITDFRIFSNCQFRTCTAFGKYSITKGECLQEHFKDGEMISGNLLCISEDNFQTFFFGHVVSEDPDTEMFILSLYEYVPFLFKKTFSVAEYKKEFFRATEFLLKCMRINFYSDLIFEEYFLLGRNDVLPPIYLDDNSKYALNGINFKPLGNKDFKLKDAMELDPQQFDAYWSTLTSKLAVIRGGPGTGKTRVALKVIETLVENEEIWKTKNEGPILLLAFTNKSLDNFLEKILAFTDSILRIGSQSKSEKLKQYATFDRREFSRCVSDLSKRIRETFNHIQQTLEELENVLNYSGLITAEKLGISDIFQRQVNDSEIYNALMRGSKLENEQKERAVLINEMEDLEEHELIEVKEMTSSVYSVTVNDLIRKREQGDADYLKWRLSHKKAHEQFYPQEDEDISIKDLSVNELWGLYFYLVDRYIDKLTTKVKLLKEQKDILQDEMSVQQWKGNISSLQKKKIIGLTFSGAAGRKSFLNYLDSPITIVEEASEIEYYHLLSTIPETCKHLILIGDDKSPNLKSNCIDRSLIDLISDINYPCHTLYKQYRMRPEISYLLRQLFYPQMEDGPCILEIPDVPGIAKNVFFINHNVENDNPEQINWKRLINSYEVDYMLQLAKFLISQGCTPESITILTITKYQAIEFDKKKEHDEMLQNIMSYSIDKFQSLQNDIILLSLVGINEHYQGFLTLESRIAVGLSRAKQGLYMIGNIQELSSQYQIWRSIEELLVKQEYISTALPLRCELHTEGCAFVEQPEGFLNAITQLLSCKL